MRVSPDSELDRNSDAEGIFLEEDLYMRHARENEVDSLVEFNSRMFDERVRLWTRDLVSGKHPTTRISDFTVVENVRTGKIISSLGLISQTWAYRGIPFGVGRPELVATEPDYRRRGLVRKQMEMIHAVSARKGELMQVITGVDWFYRQFGYEMGVRLWGSRCFDFIHLPQLKDGQVEACRLRPATPNDYTLIRELYAGAGERQLFSSLRSSAEWDYEFGGRSPGNTRRREWLIIESVRQEPLGYVQYLPCAVSEDWPFFRVYQIELQVGHSYLDLWPSLLRGLWGRASQSFGSGELVVNNLQGLELTLEKDHALFRCVPKTMLREIRTSPWYIRIPSLIAFLKKIRPALESNLQGTDAEGFNGDLKLDLFQGGIRIEFRAGKIVALDSWVPNGKERPDARCPQPCLVQMACGWRRFHELCESFPECSGRHEAQVLLDCLFPPFHDKMWVLA